MTWEVIHLWIVRQHLGLRKLSQEHFVSQRTTNYTHTKQSYVVLNTLLSEVLKNDVSQNSGVWHPFHNTMLLIQRNYRVCPNIYVSNHHDKDEQSCRRLDAASFLSNLLMMLLNSISRASLRKSSFGLTRKGYRTPSVPRTVIFLGFCIEFITSTSSSNAIISGNMRRIYFAK